MYLHINKNSFDFVSKKSKAIFEDDKSTDFSKLKKSELIDRLESYRRHEESSESSFDFFFVFNVF